MQSKVLCLLFVALVASSVTAGRISETLESVATKGQDTAKNATHGYSDVNILSIVLPPVPNIIQLPNVASGVKAAEDLLVTNLGTTGNLAEALQNLVTAALKSAQPVADLINVLSQIVNAFSQIAAEESLNVAVLIIKSGVQVVAAVVDAVIPVVEVILI
ncbi:hypothetical protein K0M31_002441 [Melipona bicolor]|uniref:Uncharacterized protein n=1 Tax=Melipona bicolor TaxID=60889 RepID=A0AA40GI64_9HYME|nr:hypothetical protein K0M31_002441 [Melipona bicolor]